MISRSSLILESLFLMGAMGSSGLLWELKSFVTSWGKSVLNSKQIRQQISGTIPIFKLSVLYAALGDQVKFSFAKGNDSKELSLLMGEVRQGNFRGTPKIISWETKWHHGSPAQLPEFFRVSTFLPKKKSLSLSTAPHVKHEWHNNKLQWSDHLPHNVIPNCLNNTTQWNHFLPSKNDFSLPEW